MQHHTSWIPFFCLLKACLCFLSGHFSCPHAIFLWLTRDFLFILFQRLSYPLSSNRNMTSIPHYLIRFWRGNLLMFRKSEEPCMYMHFGASFMRIHSPDCPNVVGSGMLHYQGIYCFYFSWESFPRMGDGIACQITSYVGTEPIYCVGLRRLLLRAFV